MINLWKYSDCEIIRITDVEDKVFEGAVTDVLDSEEQSDLEKQEDSIGIFTKDKQFIVFFQSEIKSIEIIK